MSLVWKMDGEQHHALVFPLVQQGNAREWDMTLESDEDLLNSFLYTDAEYSGVLWAKRSDQSTYRLIGVYSLAPSCYIGNLVAGVSITINFRMKFGYGDTYLGVQRIWIGLGSGEEIEPAYGSCQESFWQEPDAATFWNIDETDVYWLEDCVT
jgi:hypothetical protein